MSDVVRIKVGMEVGYIAGSTREYVEEIPRAEWDAMTEGEREERLEELAQGFVDDSVNAWAYVDEEG